MFLGTSPRAGLDSGGAASRTKVTTHGMRLAVDSRSREWTSRPGLQSLWLTTSDDRTGDLQIGWSSWLQITRSAIAIGSHSETTTTCTRGGAERRVFLVAYAAHGNGEFL